MPLQNSGPLEGEKPTEAQDIALPSVGGVHSITGDSQVFLAFLMRLYGTRLFRALLNALDGASASAAGRAWPPRVGSEAAHWYRCMGANANCPPYGWAVT